MCPGYRARTVSVSNILVSVCAYIQPNFEPKDFKGIVRKRLSILKYPVSLYPYG